MGIGMRRVSVVVAILVSLTGVGGATEQMLERRVVGGWHVERVFDRLYGVRITSLVRNGEGGALALACSGDNYFMSLFPTGVTFATTVDLTYRVDQGRLRTIKLDRSDSDGHYDIGAGDKWSMLEAILKGSELIGEVRTGYSRRRISVSISGLREAVAAVQGCRGLSVLVDSVTP